MVYESYEQQVPDRRGERPDEAEQDPLAKTWPWGEMSCGMSEIAKTPPSDCPGSSLAR